MAKKNTSKNTMGKVHSKKHYCEECGATLSQYEFENYGDLCETCYSNLVN